MSAPARESPVFLMRTAQFHEQGYFDDVAHAQVKDAADLVAPLLAESGVTIATGTTYKLQKTAYYLDQALQERSIVSSLYGFPEVTNLIERGRLNPAQTLPEVRGAVDLLRSDMEMGRIAVGGLIIVTSEYPVSALRHLQEEDYYGADHLENGAVVLAHPGIL